LDISDIAEVLMATLPLNAITYVERILVIH